MTALTPREIMIKQSDGSVAKAEGSIGKLFLLAMMAGAFIALGAQGSLMASFNLTSDPSTFGIGKVVMGAVFPVGLMMVVICGAELFTGNCLMIIGTLDKKIRLSGLLRNWAIVYLGNLAGSLIIVLAIAYSGLWDSGEGLLGAVTVKTAVGSAASASDGLLYWGSSAISSSAWQYGWPRVPRRPSVRSLPSGSASDCSSYPDSSTVLPTCISFRQVCSLQKTSPMSTCLGWIQVRLPCSGFSSRIFCL